jgi:Uma2 family endonuclease
MAVALKPQIEIQPPDKRPMTLADFDALPEGPPDYEFERGRFIDMPRPHPRHQKIILRLGALLDHHVSTATLGAVWPEVDVQLSRWRVLAPDLVFLSQAFLARYAADRGRIVGAPDLVVEVVSPASASRDRVTKFNAYREAGVPWYWLIDSQSLAIEEYRLMSEGYLAVARVAAGERFRPQLFPELDIDLAELVGEAVSAEAEAISSEGEMQESDQAGV